MSDLYRKPREQLTGIKNMKAELNLGTTIYRFSYLIGKLQKTVISCGPANEGHTLPPPSHKLSDP